AVRKRDVVVGEGKVLLGDLLEAEDERGGGGGRPAARGDELGAGGRVLGVVKDALVVRVGRRALHGDGVAGLDAAADDGGREGAVLEGLLLRPEQDGGVSRHDVCVCGCGGGEREGVVAGRQVGRSVNWGR